MTADDLIKVFEIIDSKNNDRIKELELLTLTEEECKNIDEYVLLESRKQLFKQRCIFLALNSTPDKYRKTWLRFNMPLLWRLIGKRF